VSDLVYSRTRNFAYLGNRFHSGRNIWVCRGRYPQGLQPIPCLLVAWQFLIISSFKIIINKKVLYSTVEPHSNIFVCSYQLMDPVRYDRIQL
jgi:hypothetical protein